MSVDTLTVHARRIAALYQHAVVAAFIKRWAKELGIGFALFLTLAAPWVLKPKETSAPSRFDRRIVIITPQNDNIRHEFGVAFARHWKQKTGETLYVDWRVPGGTSEISMFLRSEFTAAFQRHWTHELANEWTPLVAAAFGNDKVTFSKEPGAILTPEQEARKTFLNSPVGIKIDLFFGGGSFDFEQQAKAGILVSADENGKHGLGPLMMRRAEWFKDDVIPQSTSGEPFYDQEQRWVGTCLSTMGIVFNRDVLKRLKIEKEPSQWVDLADSRLAGQIALSDPNKSGTVTKALEQIIQQQMQLAVDEVSREWRKEPKAFRGGEKEVTNKGVALGWERGLQLIQRICANARYFTDAATKIPLEVAQGDAAAGMCIDFYGRSFEEQLRKADGTTRVGFIAPKGGSSFGVDPVGMLRGAPEPAVAEAFMEFVLSDEGQKLWNYRVGTKGGPMQDALRRLPVRRDFYTESNRASMSDSTAQPFEDAKAFTYHPEWTASLSNVIRFVVKVMSVDAHDEQKHAWRLMGQYGFPVRAMEVFSDVNFVNYQNAQNLAGELKRKDKDLEVRKARDYAMRFRQQYARAGELARRGQ
ncbi:MAG: extracellular solute-binding protein [Verrucomicrobia bacterium]|nr:extracellular solute-binding protein [Verrucomicrobiota bacterium]